MKGVPMSAVIPRKPGSMLLSLLPAAAEAGAKPKQESSQSPFVIPAKAGIHLAARVVRMKAWRRRRHAFAFAVIPAKAGIHVAVAVATAVLNRSRSNIKVKMDPGLRRDDGQQQPQRGTGKQQRDGRAGTGIGEQGSRNSTVLVLLPAFAATTGNSIAQGWLSAFAGMTGNG